MSSLARASLAIVALGGLLVGCSSAPDTFVLEGTMAIGSNATTYPSPGCHGYQGYDDIDEGNSGEDEDVEAAALSMAAKLEGMTEIEQLEFQIKQLKMLQALKAGQDRTCPPGCKC